MTVVTINIDKGIFNEAYLPVLDSNNRYNVLIGGSGSGKSVYATQHYLQKLMKDPGRKLLVIRKIGRTLRDSVWAEFSSTISKWGINQLVEKRVSVFEMELANRSSILFRGLDDSEKIKSIEGLTDIWIEEANEITETDFFQLDLRLRGKARIPYQIMLTLNPNDYYSWVKKTFVDNKADDAFVLNTNYKDNKFLDDRYIKVLEDLINKDMTYYRIYALGEWCPVGSTIFSNWQTLEVSVNDSDYDSILMGMDFGFNDPSAVVKVGIKDGDIYILDELYKRELTNMELMERVADQFGKGYRLTADSSEPSRIKEFKQNGFKAIPAVKGKDSVLRGIDFLRTKKIYVSPQCQNFINEIRGYKYREDKNGNVLEEPVDINNHLLDSLRYAIEHLTHPSKKAVAVNRL